MTAVDGVYWALALAIVLIAAALTWFIVRCAGTVGRITQVIADVRKEVPAASASVRKVLENAESVTADVADASSVIRDGAAAVRLLVERVRDSVKFLDETIFSKLAALAPLFVLAGSWLERLTGKKKEPAVPGEEAGEGAADNKSD
ncbi:MAG TPA: hypothetical protein VMX79_08300 [bacterium]|nr:hypothetical protein [bacterium]